MWTWLTCRALVLVLAFGLAVAPLSAQGKTLVDSDTSPTGTWTPSVGGTATYTQQTGTYTKVGKLVFVSCRLIINAIGTGSTSQISGLPYPVDLTPVAYGTAAVYFNDLAASVSTVTALLGVGVGETSIGLYSMASAGTSLAQNAILGNGTQLYFSAAYLTP